ncbi:MAG TPA: BTAD domain-containing putative transcriptional regulator [Streptosporangiaceae bacterium]|nr:BTAD domain-containing putative transcriptional regulator [Streptosporangiaceae bacterium]
MKRGTSGRSSLRASSRPGAALVRGIGAIATLTVTTIGLPIALYRLGGSPIPSHMASWHEIAAGLMRQDNGGLFLGAVRDLAWLAWAAFTVAVLAEVHATLRGRPAPRMRVLGLQGVAAKLMAAASVSFTAPGAVSLAVTPALAAVHGPVTLAAQIKPPEHGMRGSPQAADARHVSEHKTVVVQPGDCLWTIAQTYLGSGDRYPALIRLNLGHDMGRGRVFTDPSLIMPGWELRLPGTAGPGGHSDPRPSPRPGDPGTGSETGSAPGPGHGGAGDAEASGSRRGAGEAAGQHDEAHEAVLFTLGMIAGAALACLERLRHRQRQYRRPGRRIALPADADGQRIECKLRAAASAARPTSLRDALCDLSAGVAASGDPLPPIVGIHLTAGSIDVLLSAPASGPPPPPFSIAPGRQGMCWTAALARESSDQAASPPMPGEVGDLLPGLFTAGATDDGYLVLDLEAMRVTCCDGPADLIDRLLVTAATELAASRWSGWYQLILVGCDELDVLGRAERCPDLDVALELLQSRIATIDRRLSDDRQADVRTRRMEDPEDEDWGLTLLVSRLQPTPDQMARLLDLSDGPGGIAALVAGDTEAADGKHAPTVFRLEADPDDQASMRATITLAYLGPNHKLSVQPQTLTVDEYEALARLFATAADASDVSAQAPPYDDADDPPWMQFAAAPVLAGLEEVQAQVHNFEQTASADAGRSNICVNVLGTFEVLGSVEPLQPKQAELVLALALHAPVGLANSALCTMLGADADHPRPADSVRQLITRTRRRLGQAPDGREYIVHLGSGIYVPHDDIQLDWAAFSVLARRGRAENNMIELRAALDLVRGEPFAQCFYWWIDIALVEAMRAEIVDTADLLARLEMKAGNATSAAQAARIGLTAESAAEQLWRALMRAEHAAGNPAGVADAWSGCLDVITEIAPGGEPHPDTERLYRELSRDARHLTVRN